MNGLTGICDSTPVEGGESSFVGTITASMPSGYGSVLAASAGSLVGLATLMNCWPQLKNMAAGALFRKSAGAPGVPSARFRDIGHRREEEERGLMSYTEDDDML